MRIANDARVFGHPDRATVLPADLILKSPDDPALFKQPPELPAALGSHVELALYVGHAGH